MDRVKRYRYVVGAMMLIFAVGIVGGLLYLNALIDQRDATGSAEVTARVHDAAGSALFNGTLTLENATALGALDAAARRGNFTYETRVYPGMGTYVSSINGTAASGSGGWVYRVLRGGEWCWGDRAADRYALREGDVVAWEWADGPNSGGCRAA